MNRCLLHSIWVYLLLLTDIMKVETGIFPLRMNLISLKEHFLLDQSYLSKYNNLTLVVTVCHVMKYLFGMERKEVESCFFFWQQYFNSMIP